MNESKQHNHLAGLGCLIIMPGLGGISYEKIGITNLVLHGRVDRQA